MSVKKGVQIFMKVKKILTGFLKYLILIFAAFCTLVPIVSCIITAFKTDEEYQNTSVMTLPESWLYFENFKIAWQKAGMGKAFLNTLIVLICVIFGSIMISAMLAYAADIPVLSETDLQRNFQRSSQRIITGGLSIMNKINIIGQPLYNIPWQDCPEDAELPVWRYSENRIIQRNPVQGVSRILNSAVLPYENGYIGVFRGEQTDGIPYIYLGRSADGIHWQFEKNKIRFMDESGREFMPRYAYDPRLVKIEDMYYIIWCQDFYGASIGMAKTTDFKTFTRIENPFLPFNRNAVLFPRKINDKFVMLSRPSDSGHTPFGDIFLSESPDLEYWGHHRHVMSKSSNWWESLKIGGGCAPIETDKGWLLIYHGVTGTCNGYVYSMGAALLDKNQPSVVLKRASRYILTPETWYEERGFVPNVCFPCASLTDSETGRIAVYYGCADSYVGLAFTTAEKLYDYILKYDCAGETEHELGRR